MSTKKPGAAKVSQNDAVALIKKAAADAAAKSQQQAQRTMLPAEYHSPMRYIQK